eukprot:3443451-Rhodomonas_salina.1
MAGVDTSPAMSMNTRCRGAPARQCTLDFRGPPVIFVWLQHPQLNRFTLPFGMYSTGMSGSIRLRRTTSLMLTCPSSSW